MTPRELAEKCAKAIEGGWEHVQLVIPGHVRGQRVRLDRTSRRKCPMGERVCDLEASTLVAFDAYEVLAWLVANGAIEVEATVKAAEVTP
jgi:hypothetical protein